MAFIPFTPGGSMLVGLAATTYAEAKRRLMFDAQHMPYGTWKNFKKRGYVIENIPEFEAEREPLWAGYGLAHPDEYKRFRVAE